MAAALLALGAWLRSLASSLGCTLERNQRMEVAADVWATPQ